MIVPDPDGLAAYLRRRAESAEQMTKRAIGDRLMIARLADRFGVSSETARDLLRKGGWERRVSPGTTLPAWWPPI